MTCSVTACLRRNEHALARACVERRSCPCDDTDNVFNGPHRIEPSFNVLLSIGHENEPAKARGECYSLPTLRHGVCISVSHVQSFFISLARAESVNTTNNSDILSLPFQLTQLKRTSFQLQFFPVKCLPTISGCTKPYVNRI